MLVTIWFSSWFGVMNHVVGHDQHRYFAFVHIVFHVVGYHMVSLMVWRYEAHDLS